MDEYLSDNEQVERLRAWWRENGWFVLGGVALGFLVLFGWRQYGEYQELESRGGRGDLPIGQASRRRRRTRSRRPRCSAKLRAEYPSSAYTAQAGLLVASSLLVAAPDRAAEELRHVMEDSTDDPELAMIARLRLARVLAYREQYDEALKLLAVAEPGQFAGRLSEVKGDIQAALGHVEEARAAYLAAMVADGSELLDRNFVQMKLNDLPGAAPDAVRLRRRRRRNAARGSDRAGGRESRRGRVTERRSLSFACLLLDDAAVVGCAGKKDTTEPPAELVAFKQTLDVRKVWSGKVGGGAERLRLGLRPATDGARIYAGSHDGQVAAFDALTGRKLWSVEDQAAARGGSGLRRRRDRVRHDGRRSHRVRRRDRRGALAPARRQRGARALRRSVPRVIALRTRRRTVARLLDRGRPHALDRRAKSPRVDLARQYGAAASRALSS